MSRRHTVTFTTKEIAVLRLALANFTTSASWDETCDAFGGVQGALAAFRASQKLREAIETRQERAQSIQRIRDMFQRTIEEHRRSKP